MFPSLMKSSSSDPVGSGATDSDEFTGVEILDAGGDALILS
jgi:hypothetical protein